jgi:hypothetical protein
MTPAAREFFTVDLRGLRAALAARAAKQGITESDLLRSALATALGSDECGAAISTANTDEHPRATSPIKLSVRLSRSAAEHLNRHARAAGLSRGAYLSRLIEGAPPVLASTDRVAGIAALSASANEVALLSRDINHLAQLLCKGSSDAARQYTERLETLDADVRAHLALAAATLAELAPARRAASGSTRPTRVTATHPWSTP